MTALLMILSFVAAGLFVVLGLLSWRVSLHRNPVIDRRLPGSASDEAWAAGYRASAPWTLAGGVAAVVVGIIAMFSDPDPETTELLFLLLVLALIASAAAAVLAARRASRTFEGASRS